MTLTGAIAYYVSQVALISEIKFAPPHPPEGPGAYPFVITFTQSGELHYETALVMRGLHDLVLQVHENRNNLPFAFESLNGLIEPIATMIKTDPLVGGNAYLVMDEAHKLRYRIFEVEYNTTLTLALRFEFTIKIRE